MKKVIILFLLILCVFSCFLIMSKKEYTENKEKNSLENIINILKESENILEQNKDETSQDEPIQNVVEEEEIVSQNGEIGLIIIPSIEVNAPIYEGTSSEVLKYSVGHFKETSLWTGNVALASHNRGSYAHYFSKINYLKKGEEIIYITNMGERRYKVTENKIIEETNIEVLKNTEENTITLITCVTAQRNKRRCVIGTQY